MRIAIIGSGYVGLVTGAGLSETGNTVNCIDNDERKIRTLKEGRIPFFEPGLDDLVERNAAARLREMGRADVSLAVLRRERPVEASIL